MKIQCDVCEKAQAAVICCADEAALCVACDVEIHAANKLASKHQRLRLDCLSTKLPRCDICQEKVAFIFCVEDRALFCQDCDESIHVDGTRSANHQRYLATGIRVALSTICNKDSNDNNEPPSEAPAVAVASATKVPATQVISSFMNSAWDVDEFLQLSDHETSHKMPKGIQTAAQVPELPAPQASNIGVFRTNKFTNSKASNNTGSYRANKYGMVASKKPRLEFMDDEEFFTVPDLG
ncbi:B-box zinc finger protein 24-like isoform X2 [Zingiber officinale]|uniref:B-box zinc finger protein 24-like isoform X2 n=1 Tax=Zingiber officinale TaxID=94328 RepID=UPI001C4CC97B|nr:B-box zinc finger protein 24-like isoform X2 [Zingiber officinale]